MYRLLCYDTHIMTQATALEILATGQNIFLTGEPGAGKTYTINRFIAQARAQEKGVAVTASTGIAATHIGGITIHSWSGIGIRKQLFPGDIAGIVKTKGTRIKKTKILIIDEVSMLDAEMLDMVDAVCKAARESELPFGGIQVVVVGDFFQLPPVRNSSEPPAQFAFIATSWNKANFAVCYLSEQHRQDDDIFLSILSAIRSGTVSEYHGEHLNTRFATADSAEVAHLTKLFPHNANVDVLNETELKKLPAEEKVFIMETTGKANIVEALVRGCLSPEELVLKKGARVMCTKNNFEAGYVNGTLGMVIDFDEDGQPIIETRTGKKIAMEPVDWAVEENGQLLARITQIPLRLAWAITVHKSQGVTLDGAFIDLRRAFVEGQGYVALSRVKSLAGLYLAGYNAMALRVHPMIIEQDLVFRTASQHAEQAHNEKNI